MKKIFFLILILFVSTAFSAHKLILTGADQPSLYLPLLKNKKVGLFINHSSLVGKKPLVDFLLNKKIHVTKIFVPEHGLRGDETDGYKIENSIDKKSGLPVISLYGKKTKPTKKDLENVDILVFDVQDVGVSFYTYISSLQRLMEAAVENHKPLIVLDRPNPNGFYVDGPVTQTKSFTGLQPIAFVHGMTIGEYARMLVGEQWLNLTPKSKARELKLTVIRNANYTHKSLYEPPVPPSPNLPNIKSIYLYPSIGYMEGTVMSVGRGTAKPFQVFGHPSIKTRFTYIPVSRKGAINPLYENQVCHGWDLSKYTRQQILKKIDGKFQIKFLKEAYNAFPDKKYFFNGAKGSSNPKNLAYQIRHGFSEHDIRKSWEPELSEFKKIRKKYLLYKDFS